MTYSPLLEDRALPEAPHLVSWFPRGAPGAVNQAKAGLSYNRLLRSCPQLICLLTICFTTLKRREYLSRVAVVIA